MEKLDYAQAQALALESRWKTEPCHVGESCWCAIVVPETPIEYDGANNQYYVIGAGEISRQVAERIVADHNRGLTNEGQ